MTVFVALLLTSAHAYPDDTTAVACTAGATWDGDGRPDLATATSSGEVRITYADALH
jgi:hypothetical protein